MLKSGAKTGITDAELPDSGHPIVIPHPGLRRMKLMGQYHPCCKACEEPPLDRSFTREEYEQARRLAEDYGSRRLDQWPIWREWGYP